MYIQTLLCNYDFIVISSQQNKIIHNTYDFLDRHKSDVDDDEGDDDDDEEEEEEEEEEEKEEAPKRQILRKHQSVFSCSVILRKLLVYVK